MQISHDACKGEVKIWKELYQAILQDMGGPAWRQSRNPTYHMKSVDTFCEYATAWLRMLDERYGNPQQRKYLLYLILWAAKDIAHPYIEKAWERLDAEYGDSTTDLKTALHTELTSIVRDDVANNMYEAAEFANLCKQVGVSLDNRPTV